MSSIERFFTRKVDTQRLIREVVNNTEVWETKLTGIQCHIQTWAAGSSGYEGSIFSTHQMWCGISKDIIKGDRVIEGATIYEVYSIERLNFGENPHLQVFLSLIEL